MKTRFLLFYFSLVVINPTLAQVVTEDVHFDFYQNASNNDFVNYFSNGLGMSQIQTNGITGGCLSVPDSISWGNDNAVYCSHYKPNSGDTTITSICFKYDSTTVQLSSFQRAISIFLRPYADFNHYVIATVSGNKKLELITYGWVNTPYPNLNLLHNHWYSYKLSTAFFAASFQVYLKAEVFDLGFSGVSVPILVNSSSGTITDNILAVDTAIQVSITATTYGGCSYIDDFSFHGRKGYSNCINVSATEDVAASGILNVYYTPGESILHVVRNEIGSTEMTISVFDAAGKKVLENKTAQMYSEINVSSLNNGFYIVHCETAREIKAFKFFLNTL